MLVDGASEAVSLSFSSAILNTMRTFCRARLQSALQLPVIFWACTRFPATAESHHPQRQLFIGDSCFPR